MASLASLTADDRLGLVVPVDPSSADSPLAAADIAHLPIPIAHPFATRHKASFGSAPAEVSMGDTWSHRLPRPVLQALPQRQYDLFIHGIDRLRAHGFLAANERHVKIRQIG